MVDTVKRIGIELSVSDRASKPSRVIVRSLDEVNASAKRTAGGFAASEAAVRSLRSGFLGLKSVIAGPGFAQLVREIIQTNSEFARLKASLETVTGSAQGGVDAFAQLEKFASSTPFSLGEVTAAFIRLKALGLDPTEAALTSYGNTALAMSKSLSQFVEAVANATTGDFERLRDFGIRASTQGAKVTFIFRGISTTVGDTAEEIEGFLQKIGNVEFAGATDRQADTIARALGKLEKGFDRIQRQIGDAGFTDSVTELIKTMSNLASESDDLAISLGGGLATATDALTASISFLNDNIQSIVGGFALAAKAIGALLVAKAASASIAFLGSTVAGTAIGLAAIGQESVRTAARVAVVDTVTKAAAGSMALLRGALRLIGGPIGLAISAGIALLFLADQESGAEKAAKLHKTAIDSVNKALGNSGPAFDEAAKSARALADESLRASKAQLAQLDVQILSQQIDKGFGLEDATKSQVEAIKELRGQITLLEADIRALDKRDTFPTKTIPQEFPPLPKRNPRRGGGASDAVKDLIADLTIARKQQALLFQAQGQGSHAIESATDAIEIHNVIRRQGRDLTKEEIDQVTELIVRRNDLARATVDLAEAQKRELAVAEIRRNLSENISLARLPGPEREIEGAVRDKRDDLIGQGFSRDKAAGIAESLREQLTLLKEIEEQTQRTDALFDQIKGPQLNFEKDIDALRRLRDEGRITFEEFAQTQRDLRIEVLESQTSAEAGAERALLKILKDAEDVGSAVERALLDGFDKAADGLADFIATGKLDVGSLLQDINRQLAKFALKQVQAELIKIFFPDLAEIADPAKAARQAEAVAINSTTVALNSLAAAASAAAAGVGTGNILAPGVQTTTTGFPDFGVGAPTGIDPTVFSGGAQTTQKDFGGFGVGFDPVKQASERFTNLNVVTDQSAQATNALAQSTRDSSRILTTAFLPALSFAASGLAALFGGGGGLSKTGQILSTVVGLAGAIGGIAANGGFSGIFGGGSGVSTTGFGAGSPFGSGVGSGIGGAPGFASGGSLTVPGFGPDDSRMFVAANSNGPPVVARVSPGENISFTPRGQGGDDETAELLRDVRSLLSQIAGSTRGTEKALAGQSSGRGFNQDEFSSAADAGVLIQNAVARNK